MPSDVKLNKAGDIIEAKSHGVVTKEDVFSAINSIKEISVNSKARKIIVDTTEQKEIPNAFELLELIKSFPAGITIAIISNELQPTFSDMHFVETAGSNRSLDIKQFLNREDALEWLNS